MRDTGEADLRAMFGAGSWGGPSSWCLACAAVWAGAGGVVAAVNSAAPFDHGSWLAAYLVLVGGLSQASLGVGVQLVHATGSPAHVAYTRLALWNLGTVVVPAGVLSTDPDLVSAGSFVMLAALVSFSSAAVNPQVRGRTLVYQLVVAALAGSVLVGSALGDAAPGSWL